MYYNEGKQTNSTFFEVLQLLQPIFTLNWSHQNVLQDNKTEEILQTIKHEVHILIHLLITISLLSIFIIVYLIIYFICSLVYPLVASPLYWMLSMVFPSYLKVLLNWKDLYLLSQINTSGIVSFVIIVVLFKYMKNSQQTKIKEEKLESVVPLTNKELKERKKTRAKIREDNKKKLMKNKEDYYNKESEIMKDYKDKYVAFSDRNVIGHAETSDGLSKVIGDDTTIFTIQVGKERTEPSMDETFIE
jgi:hypothetical protein